MRPEHPQPPRLTVFLQPDRDRVQVDGLGDRERRVGINGPPLVIWLRARHATLTQLRDTLAIIFLTLNLAAIPSVAAQHATIPATLLPALAAGLLTGHVIGLRAPKRLATRTLDRALVAILLVAAAASILAGASGSI